MTKGQKSLGEQTIAMHKLHRGILYSQKLYSLNWSHHNEKATVLGVLKDMGLIEPIGNGDSTRLTKSGYEFPGFATFEKNKFDNVKAENLIKELTVSELKKNIFHLKNWWWILLLNIVLSGLVAWIVAINT